MSFCCALVFHICSVVTYYVGSFSFARLYRHDRYKELLSKKNISLSYGSNLVDEVWGDAQVC